MALRKQQVGTAQTLKRTQRTSLKHAAAALGSPFGSPKKLIGAHLGKENATSGSKLGSDVPLVLPLHAGQATPAQRKQLTEHESGMHSCLYCMQGACYSCYCVMMLLKDASASTALRLVVRESFA